MADHAQHRDLLSQGTVSTQLQLASLPASSMAASQHHSVPFHYPPHLYVDPGTSAAAAFHQSQQRPQINGASQNALAASSAAYPASSHHLAHQAFSQQQQHQQTPQSASMSPASQAHQPYYLPDNAVTAVALQQMQFQMQLQAQYQQAQQHVTSQAQSHALSNTSQQLVQQSSQDSLAPVSHSIQNLVQAAPSLPPQMFQHVQNGMGAQHHGTEGAGNASIPLEDKSTAPAIPESQMLSAYRIGRYTPAERRIRLERYREKRAQRNYNKRVKYGCRKMIADKRRRVQGRFVKREEELALATHTNATSPSEGIVVRDGPEKVDPGEDGAEDTTEDETKLNPPASSGSGSGSSMHMVSESLAANSRGLARTIAGVDVGPASYTEQSEEALRQFRGTDALQ